MLDYFKNTNLQIKKKDPEDIEELVVEHYIKVDKPEVEDITPVLQDSSFSSSENK